MSEYQGRRHTLNDVREVEQFRNRWMEMNPEGYIQFEQLDNIKKRRGSGGSYNDSPLVDLRRNVETTIKEDDVFEDNTPSGKYSNEWKAEGKIFGALGCSITSKGVDDNNNDIDTSDNNNTYYNNKNNKNNNNSIDNINNNNNNNNNDNNENNNNNNNSNRNEMADEELNMSDETEPSFNPHKVRKSITWAEDLESVRQFQVKRRRKISIKKFFKWWTDHASMYEFHQYLTLFFFCFSIR